MAPSNRRRPTRFLQGLLWSLGFHMCLLSVLSIRTFFLPKDSQANQVDIQLDLSEDTTMATHDLAEAESVTRNSLLETYCLKDESCLENALASSLSGPNTLLLPLVRSYNPISIPWSIVEDIQTKRARIYPLKLTLQYGLNQLYLTDDASSLFIPSQADTLFNAPLFAEEMPKAIFFASVDTKSGQITKKRCDLPIRDKKLQQLACNILDTLRFQPKEVKALEEIHGEITLQFAGSFDDIEPLIRSMHKQRWSL